MSFHQYSRLFTSGLLSDPSHPPDVSVPPQRGKGALFLKPKDPGSSKPADSRACSFLELADSLTSPVSPTDPSYPSRPLGRRTLSVATVSTAIRKSGPVRMRRSVLRTASLNTTDSFPHLSIVSLSAGQPFLVNDPPLPDSPTLTRRPSQRTVGSRSGSSASLSVKSETKRKNRLAALACLEGRESSSTRTPRRSHSNFMSMSDDEDEDDTLASSHRPSPDREDSQRLSAITASGITLLAIMSCDEEVEPLTQSSQQSKVAPVRNRHRSRTTDSWFPPLIDFIDLRNEEDSPNWRSFMEFSTATA